MNDTLPTNGNPIVVVEYQSGKIIIDRFPVIIIKRKENKI